MVAPLDRVTAPQVVPVRFALYSAALVRDDLPVRCSTGVTYEPDILTGVSITSGALQDAPTVTVSRNTTRVADLATFTGTPDPLRTGTVVTVDWGDGQTDSDTSTAGESLEDVAAAWTNTYAADGTYTVTLSAGPWRGTGTVTITNGVASGTAGTLTGPKAKPAIEGRPDDVTGDVFPVIAKFRCRPVGNDLVDLADRLMAGLEQAAVEQSVAEVVLPGLDNAETVTPDGPYTPADGVAVLEREAAARYPGQVTIHADRAIASRLSDGGVVSRQGTSLETALGSRVAAGTRYDGMLGPAGAAPDAGAAWVWATGPVVVRRTATVRAFALQSAGTEGEYDNDLEAMAERWVAVTFDTLAIAVQVEAPAVAP